MILRLCILLLVACFIAGCATLQGIPPSLSKTQTDELASRDLGKVMAVASELSETYQSYRDDNLKYSFWTNVPFIPLAMGAALNTYHRHGQGALANIAVAAGGLAGLNTFVGAGPNANVYQSGMNAIACLEDLRPFVNMASDFNQYKQKIQGVLDELANAQGVLQQSNSLDTSTQLAQTERNNNSGITAIRTANAAALQGAVTAAQAAVSAANLEVVKYSTLPNYAASKVRQVVAAVSGKIKQQTISYSQQAASLISALPTAAVPPAASVAGGPGGGAAAPVPRSTTPLADDAYGTQQSAASLTKKITELTLATTVFGVTPAERIVETCLSNP